MLIDNILIALIAVLCLLVLSVGGLLLYIINPNLFRRKKRKIRPVIEVDRVDPSRSEGWGFIVKGQIVLHNGQPLVFPKKEAALDYMGSKFPKNGQLIYQRWDLEKKELILGEVVKRGTN